MYTHAATAKHSFMGNTCSCMGVHFLDSWHHTRTLRGTRYNIGLESLNNDSSQRLQMAPTKQTTDFHEFALKTVVSCHIHIKIKEIKSFRTPSKEKV